MSKTLLSLFSKKTDTFRFFQLSCGCTALLLCAQTSYSWTIKQASSTQLQNNLGAFYQFTANENKHFPIDLDVIHINQKNLKASLIVQNKAPSSVYTIADQNKALIATNGGFFRENFLINGLLIEKGQKHSSFVNNSLLSAIITIDKKGHVKLLNKTDSYKNAYYAFQAGPTLISNNHVLSNDDYKIAKRIVYVTVKNQLYIVFINSSTLEQAGTLVKLAMQKLTSNSIDMAVNFDGGKSAALIVNGLKIPYIQPENTLVKTVVVFKARQNVLQLNTAN